MNTTVNDRLEALEKDSHEPQEIRPRVIAELERAVILLKLFENVETEHLQGVAINGLRWET